jgi:hypothetical protein
MAKAAYIKVMMEERKGPSGGGGVDGARGIVINYNNN